MPPSQEGLSPGETPDGFPAGPYDQLSRVIAELPRPRRVRMSLRGKTTSVVVAAILLASLGLFAAGLSGESAAGQNAGPPRLLLFFLPIVLILVIVVVVLRSLNRQKSLLADGELAIARVTKKSASRHGLRIEYEFTTPLGQHFSRGALDRAGQLSVGMKVPVFFDSQTPNRQLALCASLFDLITSEEG